MRLLREPFAVPHIFLDPNRHLSMERQTFWAGSIPPSPSGASKRQQRVLAARVEKSSCLSHGSLLKRQHSVGDPDTMASLRLQPHSGS